MNWLAARHLASIIEVFIDESRTFHCKASTFHRISLARPDIFATSTRRRCNGTITAICAALNGLIPPSTDRTRQMSRSGRGRSIAVPIAACRGSWLSSDLQTATGWAEIQPQDCHYYVAVCIFVVIHDTMHWATDAVPGFFGQSNRKRTRSCKT